MPRNVDTHAAAERNSPSTMSSLEAVDELETNGDSAVVVVREQQQQQHLLMGATDDGLPPSPYDTAWVAMVPAPGNPLVPRFPQCVDWILQNQRSDGSWGPDGGSGDHPSSPLGKDALMSTLACVLALKTWDAGEEHVRKGLSFVGNNSPSCVMTGDERDAPVGFSVIFPGMLARAIDMGLDIPMMTQANVDAFIRLRDTELNRMATTTGSKAFMSYVAEGLGDVLDWDEAAMVYQRQNGSFFNSPATTAAAAIHSNNDRALRYLDSLVSMFGSSVPTVYPRSTYSRLHMVDTLQKMGLSRSFVSEINEMLDMTYRSWLANDDEEMMLDMSTCAMAFRLLRMHGYDVSSDGLLARFSSESSFRDSVHGHANGTEALLELYKASQIQITEDELVLVDIRSWSAKLLKEQLGSDKISRSVDAEEVQQVLKFPFYTTLDRLEHRRHIEQFKAGGFHMLKTAYRFCKEDEELVSLAVEGFHSSQALYQQELQFLTRWAKEARLHDLEFARIMPMNTFFPNAALMFAPELSEARILCTKNCMLATAVDDLFDVGGSREEMENLVRLIDMWDEHEEVGFCSERVEILFRAIYDTSKELAAKAMAVQNRSVINHVAELWADLVRAMMTEAEWSMRGHVPSSMEEYMQVAETSFALGPIVLMPLYLIGPELPEAVVRCPEYKQLFHHMNVCGRLLNDLQSYEREAKQGKINSVLLVAPRHGGSVEAAKCEVRRAIEASRRELLRMLVAEADATVPRPFRQEFWNMCKMVHLFYMEDDCYSSPKELVHAANMVVFDPLRVREL